MNILHYYEIRGDKKGFLIGKNLEDEIKAATGAFKRGLEILKKYYG
jgi:hypothetical protein